ncbi:MAG TPA: excinuclease ABC subunit UvrA, partial [Chitinophagales bacterium]|nr:excinuclease ABC subunit UvrA [Chitinophagales bacterium]
MPVKTPKATVAEATKATSERYTEPTEIFIKGARVHNLKNVDVSIPKNKLVVVTGVSGSGKSSLTIDTLFAEGQRRYVESLSAYARQFLGRMDKPDVDYIKGLCPAIAIEQKVTTRTGRSTVGSLTEIYDYLRLLYARIGKTYSPKSGKEVKKDDVSDVVDFIQTLPVGTAVYIAGPVPPHAKRSMKDELNMLLQKGFARVRYKGAVKKIEDVLSELDAKAAAKSATGIDVVIDRLVWDGTADDDLIARLGDSTQTAFYEGEGTCLILAADKEENFNNRFEADGIVFEVPTPQFFNFNSPYGACRKCEGWGTILGIDEDLVIPDKNLSVYEGAIACWKGESSRTWWHQLLRNANKFDFPVHRSYIDLDDAEKELLWNGNAHFRGINDFFEELEKHSYKIQYRVLLSRYRGRAVCTECKGSRLRKDASYVKINDKPITALVNVAIEDVKVFFDNLPLSKYEEEVSRRIMIEIRNRLGFMMDVGLGYLTLNRLSSTLSGGETQRINLTRTLGSNLTSSLYLLDEPSVGLHPKDTDRLVKVLHRLRDLGNTVVVVEHEEEIMRQADIVIDMGPEAGTHGGEVIFNGTFEEILKDKNSLTGKYLSGKEQIAVPKVRRKWFNDITFEGCRQHNLKNIDVTIPLGAMTAVTGVSGSGKTTLVKQIIYPALKKIVGGTADQTGQFRQLKGDYKMISQVELVDQNPLGKSSRSNPVTYIKAYDGLRDLFAKTPIAKRNALQPKHFSFNIDGGRCDTCKGEGEVIVEMQFLADVHLTCEVCKGKRFKDEVLEATYKDKNIHDVLEMTIDDAIDFLRDEISLAEQLKPLSDVGLGYVKLGQSSSTLSGGEAQRVKLASFLGKGRSTKPVLFIFDEPTTGLHFNDIKKLLRTFDALIEQGHTVIVIEHNMEMIKCADYVVDLGPVGGDKGGLLLYQGKTDGLVNVKESYTAEYLKE